ncbi:hypothetical protein HAX54_037462, partial [Datura stramonium]|nr:hypothetical protein [Datura stramonium]
FIGKEERGNDGEQIWVFSGHGGCRRKQRRGERGVTAAVVFSGLWVMLSEKMGRRIFRRVVVFLPAGMETTGRQGCWCWATERRNEEEGVVARLGRGGKGGC